MKATCKMKYGSECERAVCLQAVTTRPPTTPIFLAQSETKPRPGPGCLSRRCNGSTSRAASRRSEQHFLHGLDQRAPHKESKEHSQEEWPVAKRTVLTGISGTQAFKLRQQARPGCFRKPPERKRSLIEFVVWLIRLAIRFLRFVSPQGGNKDSSWIDCCISERTDTKSRIVCAVKETDSFDRMKGLHLRAICAFGRLVRKKCQFMPVHLPVL